MNRLDIYKSSDYSLIVLKSNEGVIKYNSINMYSVSGFIGFIASLYNKDHNAIIAFINKILHEDYFCTVNEVSDKLFRSSEKVLSCSISDNERVMQDSLEINHDCIISVLIKFITLTLMYDSKRITNEIDPSFITLVGLHSPWMEYCNANYGKLIEYNDLPKYIRMILDHYNIIGSSKQYRVTDGYSLLSSDSLICENSGDSYSIIINKSIISQSRIDYSILSNSSSTVSNISESELVSSSVFGSRVSAGELTNSLVYNCPQFRNGFLRNCNLYRTKCSDANITNFKLMSCDIRYSILISEERNSQFYNNWEFSSRAINTKESIDFIRKMFNRKVLSMRIHEYGNRDSVYLKRQGKGDFIYGIELEVISKNGAVLHKPSYCRIKPDASLSDGGLEIVTRPDSEDSHVHNLKRIIRVNSLSIDSSCGMHVHVPRNNAGNPSLIKDRIYSNKKKYYRISGRKENKYCIYDEDAERYQALNDTSLHGTIEFRMFSSTLSIHKIRRRLQWVKAICNWSNKKNEEIIKKLDKEIKSIPSAIGSRLNASYIVYNTYNWRIFECIGDL